MKKIITLLLAIITTTILIYKKPLNNIKIVKAQSPNGANQEFKIINPYIQYMTYNFYNESDTIIFGAFNQSTITESTKPSLITKTQNITDTSNNRRREIAIAGIRIKYDSQTLTMRTTIMYLSRDLSTTGTSSQALYIDYNQNTENGQITAWETSQVYFTMFGVNNITGLMNITWETNTTWSTLWENFDNSWGEARRHFIEQFMQANAITLTTPTLTINFNTLHWNSIENATYYNIYLNGELYAQTTTNEWTTIVNGNYQVEAGTNLDGYSNSELSNTITQNAYNDIIGNGVNFYTLFGAVVDSEIYLIKSLTDYTIWGINFFNLFKLFITTCLIFIIIKFALKQKG